ncbi:hypothetical protein TrLO_g6893 [Triparma laevis f. longispina]|uniref:PPIase cyclophilin-type domain-containing protein n=1 Tax=Triparma laevis f. longispina TaxID=1714387 RepID=A0A9W7BZ01_9STRA|nr:hypothetical protein TrLO_g6893 [Triparma laevis f. longispina]
MNLLLWSLVVLGLLNSAASGYEPSILMRRSSVGRIASSASAALLATLVPPRVALADAEDAPKFSHYLALDVISDSALLGRITIGLYGSFAPSTVAELVELSSGEFMRGVEGSCNPPTKRSTDRENLEARRAYAGCKSNIDDGVTYEGSQVWRVAKDERIDFGAVRGKFIGRKEPSFADGGIGLSVKNKGAVSVVQGGTAGFTFTITPVEGGGKSLGGDAVVVGQVVDGFDALEMLNNVGVVKSGIGSPKLRDKPSRECRYGGKESNCSQLKPLRKTEIARIQVAKA